MAHTIAIHPERHGRKKWTVSRLAVTQAPRAAFFAASPAHISIQLKTCHVHLSSKPLWIVQHKLDWVTLKSSIYLSRIQPANHRKECFSSCLPHLYVQTTYLQPSQYMESGLEDREISSVSLKLLLCWSHSQQRQGLSDFIFSPAPQSKCHNHLLETLK